MLWNNKVQDCLERGQKERVTELERKKKDINNLMNELTLMCLEDMDKLSRTKVETLVTIHVYQRDTYNKILEDAKQYKIRDASDFDWVKNTRLYWKHDEEHVAVQICDVEFGTVPKDSLWCPFQSIVNAHAPIFFVILYPPSLLI